MKIFKNLFGSKSNQISKYEPNTLAEINGSPDVDKHDEQEATAKNDKKLFKEAKKAGVSNAKKTVIKIEKSSEVEKIEPKKATKASAPDKAKSVQKAPVKKTTTAVSSKSEGNNQAKKKDTSTSPATAKKDVTSTKSATKNTSKKAAESTKATVKTVDKKPAAGSKSAPKTASINVSTANTKATSTVKKAPAEVKNAAKNDEKSTAKKPITNKNTGNNVSKTKESTKPDKAIDTDEITESKTTKNGKFEIKKSKDGRYVFNLYASNNVIIATSRVYSSSTSATNGIKSVISNASSAPIEDQTLKNLSPVSYPKWEVYKDKGEQYRFRLCASNGNCVCRSQGYTTKVSCKKGIESIIKFAEDAEITKAYINKDK